MGDIMAFPDTVDEFMEEHKMVDTKQVYSNGIEYVPIFRMKQWFLEHPPADVRPVRWIPVTERLPEDSGYYIVCAKDGARTHVSFVQYQSRYRSWLLNGARAYWRITHWMPLPEPPRDDGTKESEV